MNEDEIQNTHEIQLVDKELISPLSQKNEVRICYLQIKNRSAFVI